MRRFSLWKPDIALVDLDELFDGKFQQRTTRIWKGWDGQSVGIGVKTLLV